MENPQQQRNMRSMSAPPENRNNQDAAGQQPGQRFVSRVEITPTSQQQQANQSKEQQPQPQQQQREKSPAPAQKPQTHQSQQHGNVRHIPIFVEGRDEPVVPKGHVDETDFPRRPPSPPQFQRPSQFQQHYSKPSPNWSHFQDPFFEPPPSRWGQPQFKHDSPWGSQTHFAEPQQHKRTQSETHRQKPQAQPTPQKQQQQPPRPQNEQQQEPPKPKQQIQPKDPLEKVALVQKEVDSLMEQVKQYTGNSRQEKQYMYLDEMLTRELIKLDDIDTEGKENVRTARKQAIKSIQECISLLESKAPLPEQQQPEEVPMEQSAEEKNKEHPMETANHGAAVEEKPAENMETVETLPTVQEEQKQEAIPLPPPSPTKTATEIQPEPAVEQNQEKSVQSQEPAQCVDQNQPAAVLQDASNTQKVEENQQHQVPEPKDGSNNPAETTLQQEQKMEDRQSSPVKELQPSAAEQQKENQALPADEQNQEVREPAVPAPQASIKTEKPKKEPPPVPEKPGKSPKKAKKTKKQPPQSEPVSETAIPLPAPGQSI